MQERTTFFMRAALAKAQEGLEQGELPIGAVVVLGDDILAAAHTMERATGRFLVHAELLALQAADTLTPFPGKRRDVELYTTSEPCLMCLGAALSSFVGAIYYGHEAPSDGAVSLVHGWQRAEADFPAYRTPTIVGGILRDEAIALFKTYVARHTSGGMWEWAKTIARL